MNFDTEVDEYLNGSKFSNGLLVSISERESALIDRLTLLEKLVYDKNTIHLGCVDHLPLIEQKIKSNTWLHERLSKSAKRCLGIDINGKGIDYLQNELGYDDLICADFLVDEVLAIREQKWDYMVLGEVVEHLDNPVMFLSTINQKFSGNVERLVITVPNAFAWLNFKHALKHQEFINSDHRYWFTPYTMAKVVTAAGMKVIRFQFCESYLPNNLSWRGKLKTLIGPINFLRKRYPAFRETLVVEVML